MMFATSSSLRTEILCKSTTIKDIEVLTDSRPRYLLDFSPVHASSRRGRCTSRCSSSDKTSDASAFSEFFSEPHEEELVCPCLSKERSP